MKEYVIELFVKNDNKTYLYRTDKFYNTGTELKVLDNNHKVSVAIIMKKHMRSSGAGLPRLEEFAIKDEPFVLWRVDFVILNCEDCTYTFKSLDEAVEFIKYMQTKYKIQSVRLYEDVI